MATSTGEGNFTVPFEKLRGRENYIDWRFQMKNFLKHENVWNAVVGYAVEDTTPDAVRARRDERALSKICLLVERCCFSHLMKADCAKAAWQALENAYEDKGLGRRLKLLRNLCSIKLEDFPSMENYVNETMSLAQQLAAMNKPIDDEFLAAIMLQGLPSFYDPMIMAIEHSGIDITSDLVKTKLLQDKKYKHDEKNDCLYSKTRSPVTKRYIVKNKNISCSENDKKICWKCKEKGHMKKNCPVKEVRVNSCVFSTFRADFNNEIFWYIDSGATNHMTCKREWLENFKEFSCEVCTASGDKVSCTGKGDVTLLVNFNGKFVKTVLTNVLYVPSLYVNLISVCCLVQKGFQVEFIKNECNIYHSGKLELSVKQVGATYRLASVVRANVGLAVNASKELWHKRLGHLNYDSLKLLRDGVANDCYFQDNTNTEACDICLKGKQARFPFRTNAEKKVATNRLDLIHSDICGPMPTKSLGGKRYILTFLDDHTRKVFVYFLDKKSEVCKYVKDFIKLVENQCTRTVKILRSDNGTEYVNHELSNYLKSKGIIHQLTVPYSPQQNGAAERLNRSLLEKVRCLLYNANLNHNMWAEAANTAAYILNRSPTRKLSGMTPEEAWSGKKVSLKHLRVFGCEAYAHVDSTKRNKLEPKSKRYIFVGYEEYSKAYRLYDSQKRQILKSRDVVFNENVFPGKLSAKICPIPIFLSDRDESEDTIETITSSSIKAEPESVPERVLEHERVIVETIKDHGVREQLGESHASCSEPRYNLRSRIPKMMVCSTAPHEPQTVKEALNSNESELWRRAMQEEINSFIEHRAWDLVEKPLDKNVVKNKWIFKIKRDAEGKILRYKARLVAKGFTQKYGEDFTETFSPVVRHSAIRLLLAIAVQMDLDIDHLDVQTAFLNGDLEETIYMIQPEGFVIHGNENKVYKLNKAVYGLKQASRAWYQKVKDVLIGMKYVQCVHERCIFLKNIGKSIIVIALYVDDFFIFYNDMKLANELKSSLKIHFKVKDLGAIAYILGIKIERDRTKGFIKLSQESYINQILERFGMIDCKPVKTPLETKFKLVDAGKCNADRVPFQELIGSLMYLSVTTRPDISFAVSFLSQYNNCYTIEHWEAAKRVLRYLQGTKAICLILSKCSVKACLQGFADADWANDVDRRSYTGYVFKYGDNIVSWGCYKQTCVALSSTEAEYIALSEACRESVSLRALLAELVGGVDCVTLCNSNKEIDLYNDNQSAQKLAVNAVYHKRTKHIDVKYHYVRELLEQKLVVLKYLPTEHMVADIFTKSLPVFKHNYCVTNLNMK